jgi:predicted ABC-type ATPase
MKQPLILWSLLDGYLLDYCRAEWGGKDNLCIVLLPEVAGCTNFINADLIAAGISPLAPTRELMAASRIFLNEINECIAEGENFAFETTLAGRGHLKLIKRLQNKGWIIELIYLGLPSIEMSKMRVAERVSHGGYNIPREDIERRFPRSLRNLLTEFSARASHCACFMNDSEVPVLIFEQQGETRKIYHEKYMQLITREAGL